MAGVLIAFLQDLLLIVNGKGYSSGSSFQIRVRAGSSKRSFNHFGFAISFPSLIFFVSVFACIWLIKRIFFLPGITNVLSHLTFLEFLREGHPCWGYPWRQWGDVNVSMFFIVIELKRTEPGIGLNLRGVFCVQLRPSLRVTKTSLPFILKKPKLLYSLGFILCA